MNSGVSLSAHAVGKSCVLSCSRVWKGMRKWTLPWAIQRNKHRRGLKKNRTQLYQNLYNSNNAESSVKMDQFTLEPNVVCVRLLTPNDAPPRWPKLKAWKAASRILVRGGMNSPPGSWCVCPTWRPESSPPWPPQGSWSGTVWSWTPCGTVGSWRAPGFPSSSGRCRLCKSGACRPTWRAPGTGRSRWHMSGPLSGCLWKTWQQQQARPWWRILLQGVSPVINRPGRGSEKGKTDDVSAESRIKTKYKWI